MDAAQFDRLTRAISGGASRRGLLAGLTGGLFAGLPLLGEDAEAKRKRKKKRKKKRRKQKQGACKSNCTGGTCTDGVCVCSGGQELCGGACLDPCTGTVETRSPDTCACCGLNGFGGLCERCCSMVCGGSPEFPTCVGRAAGEACTFDAQCESTVCDGTGHCS